MLNRSLNRIIHSLMHLSLGISSIQAQHKYQHPETGQENEKYMQWFESIINENNTCFKIVLQVVVMQQGITEPGGVSEACTKGIHHSLGFQLATESHVIYHD